MGSRLLSVVLLSLLCCSGGAWPIDSIELADLAGRVEHGYYAGDERVLEGVLDDIGGHGDTGLEPYYEALASYRLAQLREGHAAASVPRLLERCRARGATMTGHDQYAAEAWILVAACAQLAGRHEPFKSLLHERRAGQALARARALDPDNPRLGLIEARRWLEGNESPGSAQAFGHLERAVQAFSARPGEEPAWGEIEALMTLSELCLAVRDSRRARDFIEQALLRAPDYPLAQAVRERVLSAH